jgi:hypothetical protein
METVLDAIRRSDGTRASVRRELFETSIPRGLIGSVTFDGNGDIETGPVTILRVQLGARTLANFPGAAVDRVLRGPSSSSAERDAALSLAHCPASGDQGRDSRGLARDLVVHARDRRRRRDRSVRPGHG